MSQQTRRRRNNRRRNNKVITEQKVKSDLSMVNIRSNPKSKRSIITPEYKISKLHWQSEYATFSSVGSMFMSKVFKANDLYDPDPAVLTSAIAGFAELARYYYYHLATKVQIRLTVTNNEAFPVRIFFGVFNEDPSTSLSNVQAVIDLSENPMCTPVKELAAKGGQDRSTMSLTVNLAELCGDYSYFYGSGYFATYYNASPATNIILCIAMWSASIFTNAGVTLSLSMHYTVKSFNRRPILDTGPVALSHSVTKLTSKLEELLKRRDVDAEEIIAAINALRLSSGIGM